MNGAIFDDLRRRMGDGYQCYAPDLPGHGSAADLPPTLEAGAQVVANLIAQEGLTDVLLVGWSMGAAIAWTYCRDFGTGALAGLVTLDMSPKIGPALDWSFGLLGQNEQGLQAARARFQSDWSGSAEAIATTMFATKAGAPGFSREQALAQILSNDPERMRQVWNALDKMDLRGVVPDIDVPYVAAFGERSRVYPRGVAAWLADTAQMGTTFGFANAGHSPHLEEADACAVLLQKFSNSI